MKKFFLLLFTIISISSISQNYISPFDFPLLLSGTFGELRSNHFHTGIDIKTESVEGKEIRSIADGYISRIKVSTWGYGRVIYIVHPETGHTSVYAHMQIFNEKIEKIIQEKQYKKKSFEINYYPEKNTMTIKQGDVIGLSGNSGQSGGPHLHFEIRDTKTEHPLNPLAFGFEVDDNINPILSEIKIYTHQNSTINHKNEDLRIPLIKEKGKYFISNLSDGTSDIKVNGNISFGISTIDRQNGAPYNKNGVYSIKLFVDENMIHHFEVDELSFSEKRFLNAHIDYACYIDNSIRFNRCYTLAYNKLSNYKKNINKGIIHFSDSLLHKIRFEVSDIKGNTSTLNFNMQSEKNKSNFNKTDKGDEFIYDQANIYSSLNFESHLEKYSLYENCEISYSEILRNDSTLSEIHDFMNENIPIHKEYVVSVKANIPNNLKEKVYIAKVRDDGSFKYKGKTWRKEFLSATTREFGKYAIVADTINPVISDVTISTQKNKFGNIGSISVKITDNQSGITFYRGDIDGKWALMEYEYKIDKLIYYFPENFIKGKHTIKITVRDKVGNKTVLEQKFTY